MPTDLDRIFRTFYKTEFPLPCAQDFVIGSSPESDDLRLHRYPPFF
jgi:hypothetical protein